MRQTMQRTHCAGGGCDAETRGSTSSALASFRFLVETPLFGDSPVLALDLGVLVGVVLALVVDVTTLVAEVLEEVAGGAWFDLRADLRVCIWLRVGEGIGSGACTTSSFAIGIDRERGSSTSACDRYSSGSEFPDQCEGSTWRLDFEVH